LGKDNQPPRAVQDALTAGGLQVRALSEREPAYLTWCAVDDFKGLESTAVILTGIADLDTKETFRRIYVGCSRARTLLGVLISENARDSFELRATEFVRN